MASRTVIKAGDYFELPLKDGRLAYCRLLHRGELGKRGPDGHGLDVLAASFTVRLIGT